jgi:hypothetical protein
MTIFSYMKHELIALPNFTLMVILVLIASVSIRTGWPDDVPAGVLHSTLEIQ